MGSLLGNQADISCHGVIYLKIKIDPQRLFFQGIKKKPCQCITTSLDEDFEYIEVGLSSNYLCSAR